MVYARNLPKRDVIGADDPYVKLFLGGEEVRTATYLNTANPTFNEVFVLPVINAADVLRYVTNVTIAAFFVSFYDGIRH